MIFFKNYLNLKNLKKEDIIKSHPKNLGVADNSYVICYKNLQQLAAIMHYCKFHGDKKQKQDLTNILKYEN